LPGKNGFSVTKKPKQQQQQRTTTKNKNPQKNTKYPPKKHKNNNNNKQKSPIKQTNKHPLKKSTQKPSVSKIAEIFQDIFYYDIDCILRLVNVKIFDNVLTL
jgi:hypothetical protein